MPDNAKRQKTGFDREAFVTRMISILRSRNMEVGARQLVDLMHYPELCDLAWMKMIRRPDSLDNDVLCHVVKHHPRHRVEAAALILMHEPSVEQLCCVRTFVPQYASVAEAVLAKLGYELT